MAKVIDKGQVPPDDPMFTGGFQVFKPYRPGPLEPTVQPERDLGPKPPDEADPDQTLMDSNLKLFSSHSPKKD